MKNSIYGGVLTLLFMGVVLVPSASAETTGTSAMLEQIKTLMAQLESLQKQLSTIQGQVKDVLKAGLQEGTTDEDIKKIQEILATDESIYPEGKVTGYYGPLTKEAIKRFQTRHELSVTGVVDEETRDLLEEYLHEGFGDKVPTGLLKAPGIMKKVEDRFKQGCEGKGHGFGPLCKKLHENDDDEGDDVDDDSNDDEGDDENDDSNDDNNGGNSNRLDADVTIDGSTTTVTFSFEGDDYEVTLTSTNVTDVLAAVADELDVTVQDLDRALVHKVKNELRKALKDVTGTAKDDAKNAIDEADDAINDAENAIDDADGDTSGAETILASAQDKLDDAENAFDDRDYASAKDLADEAADLANDATDAL